MRKETKKKKKVEKGSEGRERGTKDEKGKGKKK